MKTTGKKYKHLFGAFFVPCALVCVFFTRAPRTYGDSPLPGTQILNQAFVTHDDEPGGIPSNIDTIIIQEVIDVDVQHTDVTLIPVSPGDLDAVLTFRVTNTGNGPETFRLAVDDGVTGDDFDPDYQNKLYLDDGDGIFEPGTDDDLYISGGNDPELNGAVTAEASILVFVLNDIPGTVTNDQRGNVKLTATAATGTGSPGTLFTNQGHDGTDAVLGLSGGQDDDTWGYLVEFLTVNASKSVAISHPVYPDLTDAIPGSELTYTVVVNAGGTGTAQNVVMTDPVPAGSTYKPGTLTLNGTPLTDEGGDDAGDVGATTAGTVTVNVGSLDNNSPNQIITFVVIVNDPNP